jgi:hypothetical protein
MAKRKYFKKIIKDSKGFDEEVRIYPMSVLENPDTEYDEEELEEFIIGSWLYVSFSVGAALVATGKDENASLELYDIMHTDKDWFKKITWTKEQRLDFERRVQKLLVRFIELDEDEAWHEVQQWSGFGSSPNLNDMSEENFREYIRQFEEMSNLKND